ncbi:F-box/kelch-repeat protein At3g17530-like [Apium graveolens]|uniref:F-box/kelch-repeat protein At3g17530-like n=1 Tax=Apium graveolens TaxID=4045 RepID=UPI003D79A8D5
MTTNNNDSTTSFDDLPVEVATEIFTRLPVKTLIRSTSVCKTWYSNITNPTFISAHIQHSLSCVNQTAILVIPLKYNKSCSLISAHTGQVFKNYKIPFTTKNGTVKLVASLSGVLSFNAFPVDEFGVPVVEDYQELYLWNPSVGKYKALFSSCFKKRGEGEFTYGVGLGVHESSYDFRVVRVVCCKVGKLRPKVEVYSLRTNKWRKIRNPGVPRVAYNCGVPVGNSMVYWLERNRGMSCFEEGYVVYFDFSREVFGQIKLPDDVCKCVGLRAEFTLMNFEGKLAVCVYDEAKERNGMKLLPCCIWLMSHEDGKVSWTPRFKVVLREHACLFRLSRSGALLMLSASGSVQGLVSCDLNSQDLRLTKPLVTEPCSVDPSFVESLLMLEGRDELLKSASS